MLFSSILIFSFIIFMKTITLQQSTNEEVGSQEILFMECFTFQEQNSKKGGAIE